MDPEFTIGCLITDVINDALRAKKRILIRRHMTFTVVSTEEKIDWKLFYPPSWRRFRNSVNCRNAEARSWCK